MPVPLTVRKLFASPFPILGAWLIAGLLTIIVPLCKWKRQRQQWYNYAGRYVEYENNQRAYEEQQQYQYNNNNGQGNYNQQQGNYNQQQGNYQDGNWYPTCSWWQFKCRQNRMAYMNNNGDNNNNIRFPNWYASIGGRTDEDSRDREEMGQSDEASGAVKFVYTWTLLVFIAMLIFGSITIYQRKPLTPLIVTMLVIGQFALMQLVLLGQGVIATEGREIEDSVYGWYGQLSVLMVYSDWGYFLFSIGFSVLLCIKIVFDKYVLQDETEPVKATGASEPSDYKSMNMA